jgi:hypothetical protein
MRYIACSGTLISNYLGLSMVARLSENYARRASASGTLHASSSMSMGRVLVLRASELENIAISTEGVPGISGTPLAIADVSKCRDSDCFITDSVFAVVNQDGSICLRLPTAIASDLLENGLCLRAGKNLLTWAPETPHQLEVAWRILLHAYWNATGTPTKRSRRLWSEWVINH